VASSKPNKGAHNCIASNFSKVKIFEHFKDLSGLENFILILYRYLLKI